MGRAPLEHAADDRVGGWIAVRDFVDPGALTGLPSELPAQPHDDAPSLTEAAGRSSPRSDRGVSGPNKPTWDGLGRCRGHVSPYKDRHLMLTPKVSQLSALTAHPIKPRS